MGGRDKALREGGLTALCRRLVIYFKKTDTVGVALTTLSEATDEGFREVEAAIGDKMNREIVSAAQPEGADEGDIWLREVE